MSILDIIRRMRRRDEFAELFPRLTGYAIYNPDGTSEVDIETLVMDLVVVAKMAGYTRQEFISNLAKSWDAFIVETPDHLRVVHRENGDA